MRFVGFGGIWFIFAATALTACGGAPDKPIQHTSVPPGGAAAPSPVVANKPNAKIPKEDLAPVRLGIVNLGVPSDVRVGTYQFNFGRCSNLVKPDIYLETGRGQLRERALYGGFFDSLSKANYNVIGGSSEMFRRQDEQAEYLVGAEITSIELSMCDRMRPFPFGRFRMGAQDGNGSMSVDWQVYSTVSRSVVYRTTTDGVASLKHPIPKGYRVLIHRAFRNAAESLAADPKFRAALKRGRTLAAASADEVGPAMTISRQRLFARPFSDNAGEIIRAAVTIDLAQGHGSGFFITRQGLLLTNQHVVGDAKTVRVRLYGGTSLRGRVLRRDAVRDVALVKVDAEGTRPLPIRLKPVSVGEEIYAIGTPLERNLTATVTKGIVSAKRRDGAARQTVIQADVDVHGGSSGGPLVDRNGNVVGITFSGAGMDKEKRSAGLNFFIPIQDALKRLNLEIERPRGRPGA